MARFIRKTLTAGVALVALAACGENTPPAATSPSPTVSSPTAGGSPPQRFVVINNDKGNQVELRSTTDGSLIQVLVADAVELRLGLSVSSAGDAYYSENPDGDTGCSSVVRVVPVAGGTARTIVKGWMAAVSPDGRWLAYQGLGTGTDCRTEPPMIVRDLSTGEERRWRAMEWSEAYGEPQIAFAHSMRWAQDSRHLLYGITIGDPGFAYFVIDRTQGDDVLDGTRIPMDAKHMSTFHATFDGSIASLIGARQILHGDGTEPDVIVGIDATSGTVRDLKSIASSTEGLDVDGSGTFVILSGHTKERAREGAPRTYVWREGEEPKLVAEVAGSVAWIA